MNPLTQKRVARFKRNRRGLYSLYILILLYAVSLVSELVCNDRPLLVRYKGELFTPVFRYYPDDTFTGSGLLTRADYKRIAASPSFADESGNWMIFPLIPFGPNEQIDEGSIELEDLVTVEMTPEPRVATVNLAPDGTIARERSASPFFADVPDGELRGVPLATHWHVTPELEAALAARFANNAVDAYAAELRPQRGAQIAELSLSAFKPRSRPPRSVRLTFRERIDGESAAIRVKVARDGSTSAIEGDLAAWPASTRDTVTETALRCFDAPQDPVFVDAAKRQWRASFDKPRVRYPYPPVREHPLGIDHSGRDVLARVLYGLRISVTFGMALAILSTLIGIIAGAVQGYRGGIADLAGQRLIEIWSAIPFLYVMILIGATVGRSFMVLLLTYAIFNWIGISYYVRAEYLRLRQRPFVDAARCMGLPRRRIMYRHVLPNAMVPIITYFPFALIGAIGSLNALDYLGFGLPPPTPSWGELLGQAQEHRDAWWLTLYPALALFVVILLTFFVGEGVRDALDPRRQQRIE